MSSFRFYYLFYPTVIFDLSSVAETKKPQATNQSLGAKKSRYHPNSRQQKSRRLCILNAENTSGSNRLRHSAEPLFPKYERRPSRILPRDSHRPSPLFTVKSRYSSVSRQFRRLLYFITNPPVCQSPILIKKFNKKFFHRSSFPTNFV